MAKVKVNAVAVMYYRYIVENDAPIEVVPIIWRKLIQKLLDATPAYRARHPEKYATPPTSGGTAGAPEGGGSTSANGSGGEDGTQTDSGQSNGESGA